LEKVTLHISRNHLAFTKLSLCGFHFDVHSPTINFETRNFHYFVAQACEPINPFFLNVPFFPWVLDTTLKSE